MKPIPDSPYAPSPISTGIAERTIRSLPILLTVSRLIFASVLMLAVIQWNDENWSMVHFLAALCFTWSIAAGALTALGKMRWRDGGRWVVLVDFVVAGAVTILFPSYSLAAMAFVIVSCTFFISRRDGIIALLGITIPLTAILFRSLIDLDQVVGQWPGDDINLSILGDIATFLISILGVFIGAMISYRFQAFDDPLTFNRIVEEELTAPSSEKILAPIINRLGLLYHRANILCLMDRRKKNSQIIILRHPKSKFDRVDNSRAVELLKTFPECADEDIIVDCDEPELVDVESGLISPLADDRATEVRRLQALGASQVAIFEFRISRARCRIFLCSETPVDETVRQELSAFSKVLARYFGSATSWEEQRRELIAVARDEARRDLHDGVLQSLAALKMRLVTLVAGPTLRDHPGLPVLRKTIDIITLEQARLRALLQTEGEADAPVNLVDSLDVALQSLALQWNVQVELESEEPALPVDRQSAEDIEHLIREAIANAIRHADAKHLLVSMALGESGLMMSLKDVDQKGAPTIEQKQKAEDMMKSRSLMQRLTLVNGTAYSEAMRESAMLAFRIPMDFNLDA